jgi:hypothetical protein
MMALQVDGVLPGGMLWVLLCAVSCMGAQLALLWFTGPNPKPRLLEPPLFIDRYMSLHVNPGGGGEGEGEGALSCLKTSVHRKERAGSTRSEREPLLSPWLSQSTGTPQPKGRPPLTTVTVASRWTHETL